MGQVFAGTSGYSYPTWKPVFYPADLPAKSFLEYYSRRLNIVEINYTFHRLPNATTLEHWVTATPPEFLFALKAHMRITHVFRLKDAASTLGVFLKAIDPLRSSRRLGPILFQLPPQIKVDTKLLSDFIGLLPEDLRFTFEFRHASWLTDEVYRLLESRNLCLCLAESEKLEIPHVITSDFVYFRLRKPEYGAQELDAIADDVQKISADGKDVFLFFKHEESAEGALYAEQILRRRQPEEARASRPGPGKERISRRGDAAASA